MRPAVIRVLPSSLCGRVLVSGEPMLDRACGFIGYRGVGAMVLPDNLP